MSFSSRPTVLMLGLNYPPEPTGISPYTGAMARGLSRSGVETHVITAHPHYPAWKLQPGYGEWYRREKVDGVDVQRLKHYIPSKPRGVWRLASELSFGARVTSRRWRRPDAIVAVSPALISSAMIAVRARFTHRGTPLVVWIQDLYTLGLSETGQAGGAVVKIMRTVEGWLLRNADMLVVIHERFADRVATDFGVRRERITVVRNWTHLMPAPGIDVETTRKKHGWGDDEIVVLHAGNMGIKQGLDNVLAAARLTSSRDTKIRFVLLGAGSELERLKAAGARIPNLQFISSLGDADFAAALASADILLVNELPGVAEMAVPSKLTSYFSTGKPVIAATDIAGITADEVRAADAGLIVDAGQPEQLLDAVIDLSSNRIEAQRLGTNGHRYRQEVLNEETAIVHFTEMLSTLVRSDTPVARRARCSRRVSAFQETWRAIWSRKH